MPIKTSLTRGVVVSTLMLLVGVAVAHSQQAGSGSSRSDPSRPTRPQTPEEFYDTFWRYLVKKDAAYNTWKVLDHEPPKDDIENPHGTVSRTYANEIAAKDPENLPLGSILVREDYDDKRKRQSVSILYRVKDYDKERGNWYYLRFLETGTVAKGEDKKALAGKVASCIECHAKASGKDYVFSNDTLKPDKPAKDSDKPNDKQPAKE